METIGKGNTKADRADEAADEDAAVRTYIRYGKVDESVPWHDTLFDVSDAVKVVVDGPKLKAKAEDNSPADPYPSLVDFAFRCCSRTSLYWFKHHERYDEDGEPMGGISTMTEDELQTPSFYAIANDAIDQHNNLTKASKLKLVRLHRLNSSCYSSLWSTNLVFTAADETGKQAMYHASLANPLIKGENHDYLSFLRNVDDDKVLAILSVTDSEEDTSSLLKQHALEISSRSKGWRNKCPWMKEVQTT